MLMRQAYRLTRAAGSSLQSTVAPQTHVSGTEYARRRKRSCTACDGLTGVRGRIGAPACDKACPSARSFCSSITWTLDASRVKARFSAAWARRTYAAIARRPCSRNASVSNALRRASARTLAKWRSRSSSTKCGSWSSESSSGDPSPALFLAARSHEIRWRAELAAKREGRRP